MVVLVELLAAVAPETGLTRAQIVKHADDSRISRERMDPQRKERLVFRAIDEALDAGHIEGVTTAAGGTSTARFIVGPVPLAQ
jgi:hypothetical protein